MFGLKKKYQQNMQEAEEIAVNQVLQTASQITFPGDVITPEDVKRAADMVGVRVMEGAVQDGASARDCSEIAAIYVQVAERAALMFAPGGPMHGATSFVDEE